MPFFGEIQGGNMQLNEVGRIVEAEWIRKPLVRPEMNLELGSYVVMPNHFHAIILIGVNEYNIGFPQSGKDAMQRVSTEGKELEGKDAMQRVSTPYGNKPNQFGPQSKNLVSIVRGFKSSVTMQARHFLPDFAWQSLFHDTVIRNERAFQTISEYIIHNPQNWKEYQFSGIE